MNKRRTRRNNTRRRVPKRKQKTRKQKGGNLLLEGIKTALLPLGMIALQQTMTPKHKKRKTRRRRN